jgi:hypothetical protein
MMIPSLHHVLLQGKRMMFDVDEKKRKKSEEEVGHELGEKERLSFLSCLLRMKETPRRMTKKRELVSCFGVHCDVHSDDEGAECCCSDYYS